MSHQRPLKIVILSEDFPPWTGGIAQWAYGVSVSMTKLGHDVVVYTRQKSVRGSTIHTDAGYRLVTMGGTQWKYLRGLYSWWYTRRILTDEQPDLIIATTWNVARPAVRMTRDTAIKTLVVTHGLEVTRTGIRGWRLRALREVLSGCTRVIAVSQFTRDRIIERTGVADAHVVVVPNAIDPARFFPQAVPTGLKEKWGLVDKNVILTLARVIERKGHDMVIRALPRILQKHPETVYLIAGSGRADVIERLKALARELDVHRHVVFMGYVADADINAVYNLARIYVMISRELVDQGDTEGFGITYLEANACRKPVIGGDSGGVSDAIVDGETGFLIDPVDVDALVDRICRLLDDPALANRLGQNGLTRLQNMQNVQKVQNGYTWDVVAKQLLGIVINEPDFIPSCQTVTP